MMSANNDKIEAIKDWLKKESPILSSTFPQYDADLSVGWDAKRAKQGEKHISYLLAEVERLIAENEEIKTSLIQLAGQVNHVRKMESMFPMDSSQLLHESQELDRMASGLAPGVTFKLPQLDFTLPPQGVNIWKYQEVQGGNWHWYWDYAERNSYRLGVDDKSAREDAIRAAWLAVYQKAYEAWEQSK